jgi:hypothetical protein
VRIIPHGTMPPGKSHATAQRRHGKQEDKGRIGKNRKESGKNREDRGNGRKRMMIHRPGHHQCKCIHSLILLNSIYEIR